MIYRSLSELQKNPPEADAYIAGSDQVWGKLLSRPESLVYYLQFGRKETKRIAYAASFGRSSYPEELRPRLRNCLRVFDALSCREYDGVKICQQEGFEAIKALDPTLLLPKPVYESLISNAPTAPFKYVFIYSINIDSAEDIRWEQLKAYCEANSLEVVVTHASGYREGVELYAGAYYVYPTIEHWLSLIAHAQMVVTTSFHGVALSIALGRPFVFVPLKGEHSNSNNRVVDLLADLSLTDRILSKHSTYSSLFSKPIDYMKVHELLQGQRDCSLEFINKALEGKK